MDGADHEENQRRAWQRKWRNTVRLVLRRMRRSQPASAGASGGRRGDTALHPFRVLLRLYAHDSGALMGVYDAYSESPKQFGFFIPQLANFIFRGQYHYRERLIDFMLDKARHSAYVAHRFRFFCLCFCADGLKTLESVAVAQICTSTSAGSAKYREEGTDHELAVAECAAAESEGGGSDDLIRAIEIVGQDAALNSSQLLHESVDRHHQRVGSEKTEFSKPNRAAMAKSAAFLSSVQFIDALTSLSEQLKQHPRSERTEKLRDGLASISERFSRLQHRALMLPLGSRYLEVLGIHAAESFSFSTKERVPFLLCVEVIDHGDWSALVPQGRRRVAARHEGLGRSHTTGMVVTRSVPPRAPLVDRGHSNAAASGSNMQLWDELGARQIRHSSIASVQNLRRKSLETKSQSLRQGLLDGEVTFSLSVSSLDASKSPPASPRRFDSDHEDLHRQLEVAEQWSDSDGDDEDAHQPHSENKPTLTAAAVAEMKAADLEGSSGADAAAEIIFKERWAEKESRLRTSSPDGHRPGWRLVPIIVKSLDDLRQEQFTSQLLYQFLSIFRRERLPIWLHPYDILATSTTSGIMEAVPDTISLSALHQKLGRSRSLYDFFKSYFPRRQVRRGRVSLRAARRNFCDSLAGYAIVTYLLNIKDRHNGNILLDAEGHLVHIDFGFLLTNSPGNANFETAPFKLTSEYIEVLGGVRSSLFRRFRALFIRGFLAVRKHRDELLILVEMMLAGNEHLPCFCARPHAVVTELKERLRPDLSLRGCVDYCHRLIHSANNNWTTRWYDGYQYCCVGVF